MSNSVMYSLNFFMYGLQLVILCTCICYYYYFVIIIIIIVPGFNEFTKELHSAARDAYVAWRDAGRPRSGSLFSDMRRSRLLFRYTC